MTKDVVRVVFRVDKAGDVYALFPAIPFDLDGHCTAYEHVGQHCAADLHHCLHTSREATIEEYGSLAEELRQLGYQLQIRKGTKRKENDR